jgi:signal peptidase I
MDDEENKIQAINIDDHTYTKPKKENSFWEIFKFALLALAIVIPIRTFIAQPFIVSGSSMVPTFENNEYLIVDEISYRLHQPERGDVIVFRYPNDPSKFFIKRIIGLPGETLTITGQKITIKNSAHPEGLTLEEPYVKNESTDERTVQIPEGQYFVMGDNRSASSDSRSWGTLPRKNITGRAFLRILPVAEASVLPGDYKQTN